MGGELEAGCGGGGGPRGFFTSLMPQRRGLKGSN